MNSRWKVAYAGYAALVVILLIANQYFQNNAPFWIAIALAAPLSVAAYMLTILASLLTPDPITFAVELLLFAAASIVTAHAIRSGVETIWRRSRGTAKGG
jgi:hypothetical protein